MHADLSFEQAPPISVPYRFFLTAPWFGIAAGLLLTYFGETALTSRWAAETLALTHLLTVGFMLQAMCGALLQFVPVAAGANVTKPKLVAGIVHPALLAGCVLLVVGFFRGGHLFHAAFGVLGMATLVFAAAIGLALSRVAATPALVALRLAVVFLVLTVALGSVLAWALGGGKALPLMELTAMHVAAGLGGWALMLLIGVSSFVVPMFQLTPPYPPAFLRWAPWAVTVLVALAAGLLLPSLADFLVVPVALGLLAAAAVFAATTIRLQMRRRRKLTDPTFWFFRGGMVAVLLALLLGLLLWLVPAQWGGQVTLSLGVLLLGAIVSAINGMLYKIIPFINWLHLQRLGQNLLGPGTLPPNMRAMIAEKHMKRQMIVHFVALGAVFVAVWLPLLSRPAGLAWALSSAYLAFNLSSGVRRYREFRDRIHADAARRVS